MNEKEVMNEILLALHSSVISHHSALRELARGTDLAQRSRSGRLRRTLDGAALARVLLLALPSLDGACALLLTTARTLVIFARVAPRHLRVPRRVVRPGPLFAHSAVGH